MGVVGKVGIKINDDPIARAVGEFMAANGIDIRRVREYKVTKAHGDLALLTLTMIMNDFSEPAPKPEPAPVSERWANIVGEHGPGPALIGPSIHLAERAVDPGGACICAGSGFGDGSCKIHRKTEQTDQEE